MMESKQKKIEAKKIRKLAQKQIQRQIKELTDPDSSPSAKGKCLQGNNEEQEFDTFESLSNQKNFQKQDEFKFNLAEKIRDLLNTVEEFNQETNYLRNQLIQSQVVTKVAVNKDQKKMLLLRKCMTFISEMQEILAEKSELLAPGKEKKESRINKIKPNVLQSKWRNLQNKERCDKIRTGKERRGRQTWKNRIPNLSKIGGPKHFYSILGSMNYCFPDGG